MDFYYINNRGQRINLSDYPYIFQSGDLLNWVYDYSTDSLATRDITYDYKMSAKEIPVRLAVLCDYTIPILERTEDWKEAVDYLCEVISADVIDGKNGKLYSDTGYYMVCKIVGSEKEDWKMGLPIMFNTVRVLADKPIWIIEATRSFPPLSVDPSQQTGDFLDFDFDFLYDFTAASGGNVIWNVDHYAPCEFLMTIYGPAANPRILINEYPYQVFTDLGNNDFLQIDSRNNTVIKHLSNGTKQNIYDLRAKEQSVFEPIKPGNIAVNWSGGFGFDLTLYCERGEPKWKIQNS